MIWISKHPPIYIFNADLWLNETNKDLYTMVVSKNAFVPLKRELDEIPFTKKNKIMKTSFFTA